MKAFVPVVLATCVACAEPPRAPRNVLLVTIDTLRGDRLGFMGYERPTSPNLDRRTATATVFEDAISQAPWTRPSMATLMTGLHPRVVGLTCHNFRLPQGDCDVLPESMTTLAETLTAAGFATAGVVANINVDPLFGFDQGFEHYVSVSEVLAGSDEDWRMGNAWKTGGTRVVTDRALDWLAARDRERPFLLYLHYLDPHEPYEPPPDDAALFEPASYGEGEAARMEAAYDAEIRFVDRELERVFAALDAEGLWESTLVVLVSDHGEEFGEHGGWYHGHTMYDEQLHVPLVVWLPGADPRRDLEQARMLDVMPTVLDALGLRPPVELQGRSLLPRLRGERATIDAALSEEGYTELASLRRPPWKLVVDEATGLARLYDLAADPGETTDVAAEHPDVTAELMQLRDEQDATNVAWSARFQRDEGDVELRPEQLERLEALGYVDGE